MRLTDLLALSHVPRWSIVDRLKSQTVADHTFRVMVIAWDLSDRIGVPLNCSTMRGILTHDAPESRTADIPSPVMRKFRNLLSGQAEWLFMDWRPMPPLAEMHPTQLLIVELADKIEGYTFIAKYGTGSHAEAVASHCYTEIMHLTKNDSDLQHVVTELIVDIMSDKGRDRSFP